MANLPPALELPRELHVDIDLLTQDDWIQDVYECLVAHNATYNPQTQIVTLPVGCYCVQYLFFGAVIRNFILFSDGVLIEYVNESWLLIPEILPLDVFEVIGNW